MVFAYSISGVTESKSRPLPAFLGTILPLNLAQKKGGIGQLLQTQLPNPTNPPIRSAHPADIKRWYPC